jgi:hypothetical protein
VVTIQYRSPRALYFIKVSRFGVNPKPTVKVWMEEKIIYIFLLLKYKDSIALSISPDSISFT